MSTPRAATTASTMTHIRDEGNKSFETLHEEIAS